MYSGSAKIMKIDILGVKITKSFTQVSGKGFTASYQLYVFWVEGVKESH